MPKWIVVSGAIVFIIWYVFAEHRPRANEFNAQGV